MQKDVSEKGAATRKGTQGGEHDEGPFGATYRIEDPDAFARNVMRLMEEGGKAFSTMLEKAGKQTGPFSFTSEMEEASKVLAEVAQHWMETPEKLAEAQGELMRRYTALWAATLKRMTGEESEPVAEPEPGDNRFRDPDWSRNPFFDFLKQAYLLTSHWAEDLVENTQGLDEQTRKRAEFYVKQLANATSPSNFVLTNPEVLRETLKSNAENLVRGVHQFLEDMERSRDVLRISQTDTEAFELGKNIAVTPGKVVFQNDLLQLIQYEPTTETVYERPLLIVPPWINKYYILDLTPEKSFVKFAVDQGFTVFVISWVNPDERLKHKTFEDYMREGLLEAAEAVRKATGADQINVLGYCVGGTLLGTTLAWLAARGERPFASATFLAAQLDFSEAGDLLVFIDDAQLTALEEMMAERGYLDGSRMATVFNMLRPRDLIWPYIVNNYLLGKRPFPFDLLYWNQDSTRMPAANHSFYLRAFYKENQLAKGEMEIAGERLDLGRVDIPVYELATREDHIAPAKSVFKGARLLGGPVRFVLAGSGHIAGVINPPAKNKYQYWTSQETATSLENWLETAEEHAGSWWPDWAAWLARHSGKRVPARHPGDGPLRVIEDAPGSYVRVKG